MHNDIFTAGKKSKQLAYSQGAATFRSEGLALTGSVKS